MLTLNRLPGTINSGVWPGRGTIRDCAGTSSGAPSHPPIRYPRPPSPPAFSIAESPRLHPLGHLLGILLVGFPHGLLGCEAPASQVLAHGPDRQADADRCLINSRTAGRVHSAEEISNSSGLWVSIVSRRVCSCSRVRRRPEPVGRPVRYPGSASLAPLVIPGTPEGRRSHPEHPGWRRYRRRRNPTPRHALPPATNRTTRTSLDSRRPSGNSMAIG